MYTNDDRLALAAPRLVFYFITGHSELKRAVTWFLIKSVSLCDQLSYVVTGTFENHRRMNRLFGDSNSTLH